MTSTIQKAVRRDQSYKLLHALADKYSPKFNKAVLAALDEVKSKVTLRAVERAVESGDASLVIRVLGLEDLSGALSRNIRDALRDLYKAAGQVSVERLKLKMAFDLLNPYSVDYLQRYEFGLVSSIAEESKDALRQVLTRAFVAGGPPAQIARAIRPLVGLTPRDAMAVGNYWGGMVGQGVELGRAEVLTGKYAERLINQRAEMIARTETIRAAGAGREAAWRQAVEGGQLDSRRMRRHWLVTPDDRLAVANKTPVMTMIGWKHVNTIQVGEYVLTHKDRFRRVVAVNAKRYDGPMVKFSLGGRARIKVSVTPNHPLLIGDDWVDAGKVKSTDALTVFAKPCASGCGELVVCGPGETAGFCEKCNNVSGNAVRWSDPQQHTCLSEKNKLRWSDEANHQKMGEAIRNCWKDDVYLEHMAEAEPNRRIKLSEMAQSGRIGFGRMSYEKKIDIIREHVRLKRNPGFSGEVLNERFLRSFLEDQRLEFVQQWEYCFIDHDGTSRVGFADFYLPGPKLVIECVISKVVTPTKLARAASLHEQGIDWIQFSTRELEEGMHTVASEIRKRCCFTAVVPKLIRHYEVAHQTVYDLQVEEDESFVAGGIVVHNCTFCENIPLYNDEGVGLDEPFQTDGEPIMQEPAHPNCRCSVALRFLEDEELAA